MPHSVIEAIKQGDWNYEPERELPAGFDFAATAALPGTEEKLSVLAARVERGLPLWHPSDRRCFAEED